MANSVQNSAGGKQRHPSRPKQTDDLIQRLTSSDTEGKEVEALKALSNAMIKVFQDERRVSYVPEAAALAPITTASSYQHLLRAFSNAIIQGTADGNILEPQLLEKFSFVLRCTEEAKAEIERGPVMKSLQTRLKSAVEQAEPKTQYRLLCALSSILDAMVDAKTTGLSREELHEPLLEQLAALSKDQELRLAQVATYAHQALLSIPNDEGPYKALLRHTLALVEGGAKVAGAVSTMDPAKLFDGLVKLQEVPKLITSMIDVVNELSSMADNLGGIVGSLQKQKSWYRALRFTNMLIEAKAFEDLEQFIEEVPCSQEEEFLCGMYAQLEQAWKAKNSSRGPGIVKFLHKVLVPIGSQSKNGRVREWVKLVADTLGQPSWKNDIKPARRRFRTLFRKEKEHSSTIHCLEMYDGALPADLLKQAWLDCIEAQVFYADIRIRDYYHEDEHRLKVERLSGNALPMDQCYINLAIVEQPNHRTGSDSKEDTTHQPSSFSLLSRLKVETPQEDAQVSLSSLFSPRKRQDSTMAPPERVLIRGQAGVGKTTLCKKIVHEFLYKDMQADLFHRLLWVPLRRLKGGTTPGYKLKDWLLDEYFRAGEGELLAKALVQAVEDPGRWGKTLFILDGLDEVSLELESKSSKLLQDLLNQPHVIITSRPSGISFGNFKNVDLELETVGFYPGQVEAYIKKVVPDHAEEVQSFVRAHWLVQGLVRIPIQLEALCYSWDPDSGEVPTTMTTLYQAIELKLWKKDAARLEKSYEGRPLSESTAKHILNSEISSQVRPEVSLLQYLAFTGIYSNVIEFDTKCLDKIWKGLSHSMSTIPSSSALAKLSFLRSSDSSVTDKDRSYHFLHLTFQEYFAAQYFVEHWQSDQPLSCLHLGSGKTEPPIKAEDFLHREKYNARYDIFWRFVSGLLQANCGETTLHHFFSTIEKEPRDLLGRTHQQLVMNCLSEVVPSTEMPTFTRLRECLEEELSRWLLFECRKTSTPQLARAIEFPERILENLVRNVPDFIKVKLLNSLHIRPKLPLSIAMLAADWLGHDISRDLKFAILTMLQRPREFLSAGIWKAVAAQLRKNDVVFISAAFEIFQGQLDIPEETLEAVAAQLENEDSDIRHIAVNILRDISDMPGDIVKAIATYLKNEDAYVREAAVNVLGDLSDLPEEILRAIAALLKDEGANVRRATVKALQNRLILPEDILKDIVALLKEDADVRWDAVGLLFCRSDVTEEILKGIEAQFKDKEVDVRRAAIYLLGSLSDLPETLNDVAAHLKDEDGTIRSIAINALGSRPELPEKIMKDVAAQLKDEEAHVRRGAVILLGARLDVPEEILKAMAALVEDEDVHVRSAALEAVRGQSDLSEDTLKAIAAQLKDEDASIRQVAVGTLQGQSDFPEEILKAIAASLKDEDSSVRGTACNILRGLSDIPEDILKDVAALLKDEDEYIRRVAVNVLESRSDLSEEILKSIAVQLKDKHAGGKKDAVDVFKGPSDLSEDILKAIVALLKDENSSVRHAARHTLRVRSHLSKDILKTIVELLKDENSSVRDVAGLTLREISDLPEEILNAVAAQFKDQDVDGRQTILNILRDRPGLPEEILKAGATILQDEDEYVRHAAVSLFGEQSDLPEEILKAAMIFFRDNDSDVRMEGLRILGVREDLPEEILKAVATLLEDEDRYVRRMAFDLVELQSSLPQSILTQFIKPLSMIWLDETSRKPLSCYIADDIFYINNGEGVTKVHLEGQQDRCRDAIREVQEEMGIPIPSVLGT
jgi:HEAT repeat protein